MTIAMADARPERAAPDETFLQSVLTGLQAQQKTLESKWLYDEAGSALFDQITELEAYYPTRTETKILASRLGDLAANTRPDTALLELGSGSSVKTRLVFDRIPIVSTYLPIDISETHLLAAAAALAEDYPHIQMLPIVGDFTADIVFPPIVTDTPKLLFFPGSTIGNFDPQGAVKLLKQCRGIQPVDHFIVGFDLVKDTSILVRAYDDEFDVTAAFNLNLLVRINRELSTDFKLSQFHHEARWNAEDSRIEMHLVSDRQQSVRLAGQTIGFERGETIHTENSHKYTKARFTDLAEQAGWAVDDIWTDAQELFAVAVLKPR